MQVISWNPVTIKNAGQLMEPGYDQNYQGFNFAKLSPLRKGIFNENRTLSEVEVSLLTDNCILRLCSGAFGFAQDSSASLRIQLIGLFGVDSKFYLQYMKINQKGKCDGKVSL